MSGTLKINAGRLWMPTGWIFDEALERLAAQLEAADPPLAARLRGSKLEVSQGYLSLEAMDAGEVRRLLMAAEHAYNQLVLEGPDATGDADHYAWFLWALSELKALLRTEPRNEDEFQGMSGALKVNAQAVWEAPAWIYDLALEDLAAQVRAVDVPLAAGLVTGRVSDGQGEYSLEELAVGRFARLVEAVERLGLRYGDGRGRDSVAPDFFEQLGPYVARLQGLIEGDARARA